MRPAEVCGDFRSPMCSRSHMTLRTEAALMSIARQARERARTDRGAELDVLIDQQLEDVLLAF